MALFGIQFFIDFDRTGSSPPKQNSMNHQTLYTPSNGQKRFNPFMKDTQSSTATENTTNTKASAASQQNDENKNIIFADDDENNRNISQTMTLTNSPNRPRNETIDVATPKKIDDEEMTSSKCSINQDMECHSETPLPEWIQLDESVLIRPYNTSGVITFIGSTHFSVNKF